LHPSVLSERGLASALDALAARAAAGRARDRPRSPAAGTGRGGRVLRRRRGARQRAQARRRRPSGRPRDDRRRRPRRRGRR
jgi:hypothetical protein